MIKDRRHQKSSYPSQVCVNTIVNTQEPSWIDKLKEQNNAHVMRYRSNYCKVDR